VLPVPPRVLNVCARGRTRSAPHADIRGTLEIATVSSDSESGDTNQTAIGQRILVAILTLFGVFAHPMAWMVQIPDLVRTQHGATGENSVSTDVCP